MSLDNFQLPPILIPELYKDFLVNLESQQSLPESLKESSISSLGKNEGSILLLVKDKNLLYLPDEDLNFLLGILTACKKTMSDVALVNIASNPGVDFQKIIQQFQPDTIISFGIELAELSFPLEYPHYQLQKYSGKTLLAAPPLQTLAGNVAEKKNLWTCLKTLFSV